MQHFRSVYFSAYIYMLVHVAVRSLLQFSVNVNFFFHVLFQEQRYFFVAFCFTRLEMQFLSQAWCCFTYKTIIPGPFRNTAQLNNLALSSYSYLVPADKQRKKSRIGASLVLMCIFCIYSVIYPLSLNCTSVRTILHCETLTCIGIPSKISSVSTIF